MPDEKTVCRTPTPGKQPTRIDAWKFDLCREHILAILGDEAEPKAMTLPGRVGERLSDDERDRLGSVGWHVTTVKLELEVRGEIERIPGSKPQRLRLAARR